MTGTAAFELPSFAKINLCLHILGRREDGFHEIVTIMQTISLADRLRFERSSDLTLQCIGNTDLPAGRDNLIIRAAEKLRQRFNISDGASITLTKQIPVGGGLGGGSSNAAAAIIGLVRLWEIKAGFEELAEIAASLGSDVPFFLYGGTALAHGKGTDIIPAEDANILPMLVITPDVSVPTAKAYSLLKSENLTIGHPNRILPVCRRALELDTFPVSAMRNDFEAVIYPAFPEILKVRSFLLNCGATHAVLSGSGASVFGIFDNEETRQAALKALDKQVNWRKFAVTAIGREKFRVEMGLS